MADEVIAEMESDKVTVELTAPVDGVISEFFVEEKVEIQNIGMDTEVVAVTSSEGGANAASAAKRVDSAHVEVFAPMETETAVFSFSRKPGDSVKVDDLIAEMETDKANIEITAPVDGIVKEYLVEENAEVHKINMETKIAIIEPDTSIIGSSVEQVSEIIGSSIADIGSAAAEMKEKFDLSSVSDIVFSFENCFNY